MCLKSYYGPVIYFVILSCCHWRNKEDEYWTILLRVGLVTGNVTGVLMKRVMIVRMSTTEQVRRRLTTILEEVCCRPRQRTGRRCRRLYSVSKADKVETICVPFAVNLRQHWEREIHWTISSSWFDQVIWRPCVATLSTDGATSVAVCIYEYTDLSADDRCFHSSTALNCFT